ncbi:protein kinase [Achlya hypogyna]|uniref:Protein kinase n=1 Tax=Achlya hypogyna TaxID=1202772 RepID=A0A1V9YEZ4_ACHHY|nr:protein kinase [Achlya hypogyna]
MACPQDQENYLTACSECAAGVPCMTYSTPCEAVKGGTCGKSKNGCPYQCFPSAISSGTTWSFTYKTHPTSADDGGFGPLSIITNYTVPSTITEVTLSGGLSPMSSSTPKTIKIFPTFIGDSKITSLSLIGLNLNDPPAVPTTVSEMVVSSCSLTSIPDFVYTPSLSTLNLANNSINTFPVVGSSSYTKLQKLKNLVMSRNELTAFELDIPSMQYLDLSYNKLSSIPTTIYAMNSLSHLKLEGNPITKAVTSDQFAYLSNLKVLYLPSVTTSCPPSSAAQSIGSTGFSICVQGAASSSSSSTGLIVGIAVGVVILIAAIGGFIWYRRRQASAEAMAPATNFTEFEPAYPLPGSRRRTTEIEPRGSSLSNPSKSRGSTLARPRTATGTNPSPVYKDLLLQTRSNPDGKAKPTMALGSALNPAIVVLDDAEMVYTRTLGKGAKGVVWLASYAGDIVAVKKMVPSAPDVDRQDALSNLVAEANLLYTLRHPHIIQLIGVVTDLVQEVAVVLEYMDLGDLREILIKKKPSPTFNWSSMKGTYALHVAQGLAYLHGKSPPLIHRDIKARNVLVDSQKGAKICDFGESRLRSYQETMTSNVGTARWIAPEVLLNDDYSEKADIYSFGVLLSELDTHDVPYADVNLDERVIVQRVAVGQLRPKFAANCPEKLRRLANHCMQADPALRPDAAKVVASLADLLESFQQ